MYQHSITELGNYQHMIPVIALHCKLNFGFQGISNYNTEA